MTPKLLTTFLAVEHTGNISVAAARLNLAQSTVSDQIQSLEALVGAALFTRSRDGLALTSAGRTLKPYAENIVEMIGEATAAMAQEQHARPVMISIGALETVAAQWLPERLTRFRGLYPDFRLRLRTLASGELMRLIKDGSLDAIFCFEADNRDPGLVGFTVARVPLVVVARSGTPPDQTWEQASGFVTTCPGCVFRRIFDENIAALAPQGTRIVAEVDSIATIINLVARGEGLALVPEMAAAEALRTGQVQKIAHAGALAETPFVALSLIWRRRRVQPPALRQLLDNFR